MAGPGPAMTRRERLPLSQAGRLRLQWNRATANRRQLGTHRRPVFIVMARLVRAMTVRAHRRPVSTYLRFAVACQAQAALLELLAAAARTRIVSANAAIGIMHCPVVLPPRQ